MFCLLHADDSISTEFTIKTHGNGGWFNET
jgi:hypothetical protein